jgi:hypothetical protein
LAAPAGKGELAGAIAELAQRTWRHPTTGEPTRFGFSTIERWYYRALKEKRDPVAVLRRKLRADAGQQPAMSAAVSANGSKRPSTSPRPQLPCRVRYQIASGCVTWALRNSNVA